jgi:hypothetical protein
MASLQREAGRASVPYASAAGFRHILFGVLMALALATACSGNHSSAALPPSGSTWSGNAPSEQTAIVERRRRHGSHVRRAGFYNPPGTITGSGGSYCYMNNAPGGPGGWPTYICWMNKNDSVTFPNFWQVPLPTYISGEVCGAATWAVNIQGIYGNPSLTWSTPTPDVTGLGDWFCDRVDVVSVTFQRGTDNGGWIVDTHVDGTFTVCGNQGQGPCDFNGFSERAVAPKFFPGPPPTPLPTPVPTPTGGSSGWPSPGPSVGLVIFDKRLNQVVSTGSSPFPNSVIGLQDYLIAETTTGIQIPSQNVSWKQFGNATIRGQNFTSQSASPVTPGPFPSTGNPAVFYWIVGGSPSTVIVSAPVSGNQMTAVAFYNVEAPSVTSMTAVFATPGINNFFGANKPWFELGQPSPLASAYGIKSTYKAVGPPDFAGYYAENQILNTLPSPTPANVTPYPSTPPAVYWDDGCWIYNVDQNGNNGGPLHEDAGASFTYGPTYDSPGYSLENSGYPMTGLTINWQFMDSFLFRPTSTQNNSVWVTIGQLVWSWGGNVKKTGFFTWATGAPVCL